MSLLPVLERWLLLPLRLRDLPNPGQASARQVSASCCSSHLSAQHWLGDGGAGRSPPSWELPGSRGHGRLVFIKHPLCARPCLVRSGWRQREWHGLCPTARWGRHFNKQIQCRVVREGARRRSPQHRSTWSREVCLPWPPSLKIMHVLLGQASKWKVHNPSEEVDPGGAWQNHYFLLKRTAGNTPILHTLAYEPPVGEISLLRCWTIYKNLIWDSPYF